MKLIVVVTDEALPNIHQVADKLRAANLQVGSIAETLGTIACEGDMETAQAIEGVLAVEEERDMHIAGGGLTRGVVTAWVGENVGR